MKAAVFQGNKRIDFMEWEAPAVGLKEVKLRVKCCGICGTDQHIYHGYPGSAEVNAPVVLGHELAGEVVAVGDEVTALQVGDRVSVDPNIYCGNCYFCRNGKVHLCDNLQAVGVTRDGGMGEYCVVPAANCYLLPDEMSWIEGAMIEPLGCVLHGYKKLDIRRAHQVLIIGGGFIGQLFLQLVKAAGVKGIIVSEPEMFKHDRLVELGADEAVSPAAAGVMEALHHQFDIVIECVGRADSMELAVKASRKGGQVLMFGVASPDTCIQVSPFEIFTKELVIMGSFINPYTHEESIALIEKGIVQIESLISHRFSLKDVPEIMEEYTNLRVSKGVIVHER
ncbi:zinc-dependent alcohol dehydrogenase family protein [Paenibacillus sp. RS8]|uniref:zinc-dependent alcohol dehydrogenase family protein n=1 Tax=Paenibacillus sp. RS8 TaxID=3242681 RepID=UPI0035C1135E